MSINPRFLMARRRAQRYEDPALSYPAYARKHFGPKAKRPAPKVVIGSGRTPGQPICWMPAIHTPPAGTEKWRDHTVTVASLAAVAISFVFVGW